MNTVINVEIRRELEKYSVEDKMKGHAARLLECLQRREDERISKQTTNCRI
jgi:hypothetical protein